MTKTACVMRKNPDRAAGASPAGGAEHVCRRVAHLIRHRQR
jgi:hypothetical protein